MTPKKNSSSNRVQKTITFGFLCTFFITLIIILCFSWIPYCTNKNLLFPNIVSLLVSIFIGIAVFFLFRKINISKKTFFITIATILTLIFVIQLVILYFIYFRTGWDVNVVDSLANDVVENGIYTTAGHDPYLTFYPNNAFLVAILAFIKSIPILGSKYFSLLAINVFIVDFSGFLVCLTIKNMTNSYKISLLSLLVTIPLIFLSPWIMIPYSDTFSMIIPISVFFIYISTDKWWKYGLIVFLSIIGYFIKPTAIIVLIAIILVELFKKHWRKPRAPTKNTLLSILSITNAICLAFLLKYIGLSFINYTPNIDTKPVSFVHYLAMGQNEDNCGAFWEPDVIEAKNGTSYELNKFCSRFTSRSIGEQINFFTRKLLMNYNDGAFAWGREGHFYYIMPERNNHITDALSSIFYHSGDNYIYLSQIQQIVWIFVLFGCVFIAQKNQTKKESVLQLSLIGIFMFVMLFEARSRYLFCYSPMFIVCAISGYHKLKQKIPIKFLKRKKS